jgi:transcriptional regulator with XRE-family HTH domain
MATRRPPKRGRGRPPERRTAERRREALRLRAEGQTLAEIGRHLGVTYQAIWWLLTDRGRDQSQVNRLACAHCGAVIIEGRYLPRGSGPVPCLRCLKRYKVTKFGVRLKAYRLAAKLSQDELATLAGLSGSIIGLYERGARPPGSGSLLKLVGVLGKGLVATHGSGKAKGRVRTRRRRT